MPCCSKALLSVAAAGFWCCAGLTQKSCCSVVADAFQLSSSYYCRCAEAAAVGCVVESDLGLNSQGGGGTAATPAAVLGSCCDLQASSLLSAGLCCSCVLVAEPFQFLWLSISGLASR
ncbi:hypothetical protein Acr_09g0004970 [Actinidia rufa]|uniref:Secreted protein n=1 Tax=Actinidia rufa TaxID=165716 RepID=A0A7J0F5X9_9ERIC|nr:hypothetical protein Acr_09g0004970 [Actinidia rufa]